MRQEVSIRKSKKIVQPEKMAEKLTRSIFPTWLRVVVELKPQEKTSQCTDYHCII